MIARHALSPSPRGNLLTNVKVQYGPVDVIGRFLLLGEEEAWQRGVSLSFATFDELLAVNEQNRASWRPLIGMFDPRLGMLDRSSSYCILGRNSIGDVVSAQAARVYEWPTTSFYAEATSLRFIYKDPERNKRPGEGIEVTAKEAHELRGRVVLAGAGWYRHDYRGTGLSTVLPRVSRACALTLWDPACVMTLMATPVFQGGFASRGGFTHSASAVHWTNSSLGDLDLVLAWITTEEAISDLVAASESLAANDHRQVRGRSR
jgi:hypothetical protein